MGGCAEKYTRSGGGEVAWRWRQREGVGAWSQLKRRRLLYCPESGGGPSSWSGYGNFRTTSRRKCTNFTMAASMAAGVVRLRTSVADGVQEEYNADANSTPTPDTTRTRNTLTLADALARLLRTLLVGFREGGTRMVLSNAARGARGRHDFRLGTCPEASIVAPARARAARARRGRAEHFPTRRQHASGAAGRSPPRREARRAGVS